MFRFLFQFIAVLILFAVARSVITWILRTAVGSLRATANPPAQASEGTLASAGDLHRDPVCGTFVPVNSRFARQVEGRTVYFCSAECREKFLVSARA